MKIVIIVLILIVIIFVIFVASGSLMKDDSENAQAKDVKPPGWSKSIDKIFGGLQESVDLKCNDIPKSNSEKRCENLALGETKIAPAKDPWLPFMDKTTFRTVKLVLIKGKANIFYVDKMQRKDFENPRNFKLPDSENENPRIESLVILEQGGTLNISCEGNSECQVGQQ